MSPRYKQQLEEIKRRRRDAILSVALELFARNGYSATTTDDIARRAGISKGLIYSYFDSKQDNLLRLVDDGMENVIAVIRKHDGTLSPDQRFASLVDSWITMIKTNPFFVRLLLQLHLHDDFRILLKKRGIEYVELHLAHLRDIFADLGSADPDLDCYLLGALMDGLSLNYSAAPDLFPINTIAHWLVSIFVHHREQ